MKKSVKWLSLLCALMLLVGLTACGNDPAPESSAPGSTPDVSDTTGTASTTTSTDSGLTDPTDEVSGTPSSDENPDNSTTAPSGSAATTKKPTTVKTTKKPTTTGKPVDNQVAVSGDNVPASALKFPKYKPERQEVHILTHGGEYTNVDNILKQYNLKLTYTKVVNTEKNATLQKMIAAQNAPDILWGVYFPTLVVRNYVQDMGKYIDFDTDLWKPIMPMLKQFQTNGKQYYVDTGYSVDGLVWYNKDILDEHGLTDPYTLYKQGKWDWKKLQEYAKEMTVDANKDGTPEQYGLFMPAHELICNTTGKGFISYVVGGGANNNIRSAEVARAVKLSNDLVKGGYLATSVDDMANGKVGMMWGYLWQRDQLKALIKSDSLGLAPSPKDPSTDKHYMYVGSEGYVIPRGAKNPTGAAAFITGLRIEKFNKDLGEVGMKQLISEGRWTEEFQEIYDEISKNDALVMNPWSTFGIGDFFGDIWTRSQTESWSKIAEEISPKIDATLEKIYSTGR